MRPLHHWWVGAASIAVVTAVVACGGESSVGIPSMGSMREAATSGAVATHKKRRGSGRIVIRIPRESKSRRRMHPLYISPSTLSMAVADVGQATQTFNLTPKSSNCSTMQNSGYLTCSETAFLPSGQQTVTITLYDQLNGEGDPLSTATAAVNVTTNAQTMLSITLDGVPASANVFLNGSSGIIVPSGVATSIPLTVDAYDAQNNLIMAPGNYAPAVTLADTDTSGATTLSTTSVEAPGSSVTLNYNGANAGTATITPSISGSTQSAGAATLTVVAPSQSLLYVNSGNASEEDIQIYPVGLASPAASITSGAGATSGMAVDTSGDLWVGGSSSNGYDVVEYLGSQASNASAVLKGFAGPVSALAFDAQGNLYVGGCQPASSFFYSVCEYLISGSSISTTPSRTITGLAGTITGLAVDRSGDLYIATAGAPVSVVSPGATVAQSYSLQDAQAPYDIKVDTDGSTLVVTDDASGNIYEYPKGSTVPSVTIPVPDFVGQLWNLAIDASGNVYASYGTSASPCISEFQPNTTTASWTACSTKIESGSATIAVEDLDSANGVRRRVGSRAAPFRSIPHKESHL